MTVISIPASSAPANFRSIAIKRNHPDLNTIKTMKIDLHPKPSLLLHEGTWITGFFSESRRSTTCQISPEKTANLRTK